MARIDIMTAQEPIAVGAPDTYATANQFGANIGEAMQQLGRVVGQASGQISDYAMQERKRKQAANVANAVAASGIGLSDIALRNRKEAPADGSGVADNTYKQQLEYIDKITANIKDDVERTAVRTQLTGRLDEYGRQQKQFEYTQSEANDRLVADANLNSLTNLVSADASKYKTAVSDGNAIIDTLPGTDALSKKAMKIGWRQRVANARFQSLIYSAKSEDEFDNIEKMLLNGDDGVDWEKELKPEQFDLIRDDIKRAKHSFNTQAEAQARASIESLETQINQLTPVTDDKIQEMVDLAAKTGNRVIEAKSLRVKRANEIVRKRGHDSPTDLRNSANASGAYPELPEEIDGAIGEASKAYPDVSPAFLGNTTSLEYGEYYAKPKRRGSDKFNPLKAGNADFTGMKPKAYDALSVAGEIFGERLTIVSGHRSQKYQNLLRSRGNPNRISIAKFSHHTVGDAVDISTVGMSGARKGELVNALVQAGFTAFGEYGTHIHADMRGNVPGSFNAGGRWGGWTRLSPEVADVLNKRGFKGGALASSVDRSGSFAPANVNQKVDYTQGNKDSTSVGPYGFTKDNWLEMMKDGSSYKKVPGLDITGMSDDQLLELRKDPRVSTIMAAARASKNKREVEQAVGRKIDDAELYMAHMLGATGAVALLSAVSSNGDQDAAPLLPGAAKNHKNIFYEDGKPRSAKAVYNIIASKYKSQPGSVASEDATLYNKLADKAEKRLKEDPVTFGKESGKFVIGDLSEEGGFAQRGVAATAIANKYDIPIENMKPFTEAEALDLTKQVKDGTAAEFLRVIALVKSMDEASPGMGRAGLKQLGVEGTALGHAADLAEISPAESYKVVTGAKRLRDDDTIKQSFDNKQALDTFNTGLGKLFDTAIPALRNGVYEAAVAHYVADNGGAPFDKDKFQTSIRAVMGEQQGHPAVAPVNGYDTYIPPGVDPETFNKAVDNLTDADLLTFSKDGSPPLDNAGQLVNAYDVATEGEFVFIGGEGGNEYKIRMGDGGYLTTNTRDPDAPYNLKAFVFVADAEKLHAVATSAQMKQNWETQQKVTQQDRALTPEQPSEFGLGGRGQPEPPDPPEKPAAPVQGYQMPGDTSASIQDRMSATKAARDRGEFWGPFYTGPAETGSTWPLGAQQNPYVEGQHFGVAPEGAYVQMQNGDFFRVHHGKLTTDYAYAGSYDNPYSAENGNLDQAQSGDWIVDASGELVQKP